MNISRQSLLSAGCGIVLASGLVVILVLATAPLISNLSLSIQRNISYIIFIFSFLAVAPLVSQRLKRLGSVKKILGWSFIGIGAEFLALPFSLLLSIKSVSSLAAVLVITTLFVSSLVFGLSAGLISIIIGILLIRSR